MGDGLRTDRREARRGGRGGAAVALLFAVVLAPGCLSTPAGRVVDRKYDDPPFLGQHKGPAVEPPPGEESIDEPGPAGGGGEGDADPDPDPDRWPNVQDPGPDIANFPNSAFTIPRGAAHVEFAPVTLSGPNDNNGPTYSTQYLLRYGLTDRLEFRIFGLGYTAVFNTPQRTTGFAPPSFDFKMNLWDESKNHLIPAAGLEVYLQTEFGSPAFRSGLQPAISLLFDHTLPYDINFEWNVGLNGAEQPLAPGEDPNGPINLFHGPERRALEWSFQWALQRRFFETLDIFTHGFLNSSAIPSLGDGLVVGGGAIYTLGPRLSLFGSYNAGLNPNAPTTFLLLGFAWAL
jgi:hypothetical protein